MLVLCLTALLLCATNFGGWWMCPRQRKIKTERGMYIIDYEWRPHGRRGFVVLFSIVFPVSETVSAKYIGAA